MRSANLLFSSLLLALTVVSTGCVDSAGPEDIELDLGLDFGTTLETFDTHVEGSVDARQVVGLEESEAWLLVPEENDRDVLIVAGAEDIVLVRLRGDFRVSANTFAEPLTVDCDGSEPCPVDVLYLGDAFTDAAESDVTHEATLTVARVTADTGLLMLHARSLLGDDVTFSVALGLDADGHIVRLD
jgi:hypothetical protein